MGGASNNSRLTDLPEFNVVVFALMLNFPWEIMQAPLYHGMPGAAHWDAVKVCALATSGDGVIMLLAYSGAALLVRDGWWVMRPCWAPLLAMIGIGVTITVPLERLALASENPAWGWRYAETMPVVPVIGIGVTPVLQWVVLPLVLIWFVKRQLAGASSHDSE